MASQTGAEKAAQDSIARKKNERFAIKLPKPFLFMTKKFRKKQRTKNELCSFFGGLVLSIMPYADYVILAQIKGQEDFNSGAFNRYLLLIWGKAHDELFRLCGSFRRFWHYGNDYFALIGSPVYKYSRQAFMLSFFNRPNDLPPKVIIDSRGLPPCTESLTATSAEFGLRLCQT